MKRVSKITIIVGVILFCVVQTALCQSAPESLIIDGPINSANSSSSSSINIDNDYFTGTANVTVPFYDYTINGLDLGVRMSYNTKGIIVDRIASNVGLGWELYSGGSIERVVRGTPDECYIVPSGSGCTGPMKGYWYNEINDSEADYFSANIAGKAFAFQFSRTGQVVTIPDGINVTIKRYWNGSLFTGQLSLTANIGAGDLRFVITDESGNNFHFMRMVNHQFVSRVPDGGTQCPTAWNAPVSWCLSKVVTYEGREINYFYDELPLEEFMTNMQEFSRENDHGWTGVKDDNEHITHYGFQRLRKIQYPNNIDVVFDYDDGQVRVDVLNDKRLSKITVKERNVAAGVTPMAYSYVFNHAYFFSPDYLTTINASYYTSEAMSERSIADAVAGSTLPPVHDRTQYRLKLKSIDKVGSDMSTRRYFTFGYNIVPLPQRFHGARDLFGYANEHVASLFTNSDGTYPITTKRHSYFTGSSTIYVGTDLSPAVDYRIIGGFILYNFTDEYGSRTDFTYKTANSLTLSTISGLVLDKITQYDGFKHENDIVKKYTYLDGEKFANESAVSYPYTFALPGPNYFNYTIYPNYGNVLNNTLNGPNYGFCRVIEQTVDGSGNQIRKKDVRYTGMANFHPDDIVTNQNEYLPDFTKTSPHFNKPLSALAFTRKQYLRPWGIGLKKEYYEYDNNDKLIYSAKYNNGIATRYISDDDFMSMHKRVNGYYSAGPFGAGAYYVSDMYYPFTGRSYLHKTIERKYYSDANFYEKTTVYDYDVKNNISAAAFINSKGETIKEKYYYNYDLSGGSAISQMNSNGLYKHIYSTKIKQTPGGEKLSWVEAPGLTVLSGNIIRPKYIYRLAAPSAAPLWFSPAFNMADLEGGSSPSYLRKVSVTTKFDDKGQGIEISDMNGIGGNVYNACVIDNQTGFQLAEVKNAKHAEIAYCGFESDYSNPSAYVKGNWHFNAAGVSASYKFAGRSSFHCSNAAGIGMYTTGSLEIGKKYTVSFWAYNGGGYIVVNHGSVSIPITSVSTYTDPTTGNVWKLYKATFTASAGTIGITGENYIDEIKVYPSNSFMTTHSYISLLGKVCDIDENDNITTYEYDGFGNKTIVRDQNGKILSKTQTVIQGY